ncbi:hypothetical protein BZG36_02112 [Bifiguratus adelaidae]|uniref:Methylmalonic aciduria type A protein, mitochondrial n=1 Tax=Bifiguratus adelaidae TaxID=1938954 RepID=A0A261Y3E3_9FUNG|nr:hypothetical protein BZG36_02112 [Bifiguratus adelaidae]
MGLQCLTLAQFRLQIPLVQCRCIHSVAVRPQAKKTSPTVQELYEKLVHGDRYALSRAITLVESSRKDHREQSEALLSLILARQRQMNTEQKTVQGKPTFRIGLSGSPGVGKSTFIEAFGMYLLQQGHRVAVLAVDPSSSRTGGSILGDKTRMTYLSRQDHAYVRPTPSRGTLGGVARNTNEAIILCEASGYDVTLVETVGVGQSETMVSEMVDMFVLLVPPAGGDELQGLKKGIVELADLVIVNKADGDLMSSARAATLEYTSALKFLQPAYEGWRSKVIRVSAKEELGIDKAWETMTEYFDVMRNAGHIASKRGSQRKLWMWRQITNELLDRLNRDDSVKKTVELMEKRVYEGTMNSGQAADRVVDEFVKATTME